MTKLCEFGQIISIATKVRDFSQIISASYDNFCQLGWPDISTSGSRQAKPGQWEKCTLVKIKKPLRFSFPCVRNPSDQGWVWLYYCAMVRKTADFEITQCSLIKMLEQSFVQCS